MDLCDVSVVLIICRSLGGETFPQNIKSLVSTEWIAEALPADFDRPLKQRVLSVSGLESFFRFFDRALGLC